ncbi:MAG: glycosyl transferase [Bacteroidetes bacterium HGW-Bacteroidetes-10]|nr:MAG: glycosyl transferase [Bacteroidetes bacterium HGW-Bacteroidetes-10]
MKTLLQINIVVNSGSTGRIAEDIGKSAINNGWTSYIAYGRGAGKSQSNLIKIGTDIDIYIHVVRTRLLDQHALGSYIATLDLIKQIKSVKPDIIQLHNIHGYYINIELLFSFLATSNIPIIWTFHDCWPMTGHCAHFDYICCEKWKSSCFKCPQIESYPQSLFVDRSKKNHELKKYLFNSIENMTIVTVSNWLGNIVKQSFLSKYPIQVINNGIDLSVFKQRNCIHLSEKFNLKGKFVILGVANPWSKRKGLYDFIELSKHLDFNFKIILVGLTMKQMKLLPENIIGISKTNNIQELAEFYSCADIFLNPTWEDNFPTTNLESLACGTPVTTYKTGGSFESLSPETGFVVEKGDIQGLVSTINIVKLKGKNSYSIACRERAENLYNKNNRYLEYISLYDRILREKTTK